MQTFHRICVLALALAFVVVTLGAWVRLTDAGLGCPDWPGCFGHLTVPATAGERVLASEAFGVDDIDSGKAWREMIHRYAASFLGLLIVALAVVGWRQRSAPRQPVALPMILLVLVLFQGLLGMWTVTLKLQPLVVIGHLLGGLSVLSILAWLALATSARFAVRRHRQPLAGAALAALAVLVVQIGLGGWTSSNYAALACPDFPTCQGAWWPSADYAEGFVPWRPIESSFEGGILLHPARVAIHFVHRLGALLVTGALLWVALGIVRIRERPTRVAGGATLVTLAAQLGIGIAIVKLGLPLWLGVAHNGNAALLLLAVVGLNFATRFESAPLENHAGHDAQ